MLVSVPLVIASHTRTTNCVSSTNMNRNPSLALDYGSATPNLWGISSSSGSVKQCFSGQTLTETTALTNIALSPANTSVAGYPEVAYGVDESDNSLGTTSSIIPFPMTIGTLLSSNFIITLAYTTSAAYPSHDTGFDLWVETGADNSSQPTEYGYEIFLSFQMSPTYICSHSSGAISQTITVNGVSTPETFEWCDYTNSNGNPGSSPPELQYNLAMASQIYNGTISINLSNFINAMESAGQFDDMQNPSGSLTNYYMQGIEFGNEFYDDGSSPSCTTLGCTATPTGTANMTVTMTNFVLSDSAGSVSLIPGPGGSTTTSSTTTSTSSTTTPTTTSSSSTTSTTSTTTSTTGTSTTSTTTRTHTRTSRSTTTTS